jgi:hypothetical protein
MLQRGIVFVYVNVKTELNRPVDADARTAIAGRILAVKSSLLMLGSKIATDLGGAKQKGRPLRAGPSLLA